MSSEKIEIQPEDQEPYPEPHNWRWHSFKTPKGKTIRFGTCAPDSNIPDAVVLVLQGRGEFIEKYFELAEDLQKHNYSFWMIDWQGQGKSDRLLKDPQKGHSESFDLHVEDLHHFYLEYVKHSAVHPDVGRIPLVIMGHSMGANIALRYIAKHPDTFEAATFVAPMFGIKDVEKKPAWFVYPAIRFLNTLMSKSYFMLGGKQWKAVTRDPSKNNVFTTDETRGSIHNAWCEYDPALQLGNFTNGWLYHAIESCSFVQHMKNLGEIKIPTLFALAGEEELVDNDIARKIAGKLNGSIILDLPTAKHEILMENDEIRNKLLNAFDEMLKENNIKDKLKRF